MLLFMEACEPSSPPAVHGIAAPDTTLPTPATSTILTIDTLARDLVVPWGVALAPDGRIFVAERPGRIRVVQNGRLRPEPWATLDVYAEEIGIGPETGLMGIALAPDFASTGHIYVVATTWRSVGDRERTLFHRILRRIGGLGNPEAALRYRNQVVRFTEREGRGSDPRVIVDDLAVAFYHAGGGIAFGPDGSLYVSVGDALLPTRASHVDSHIGRLLRYHADGRVPDDNPTPGNPTWARGLRNTQAFTWLADGTMLGVEHGPSGMAQENGRGGHDELNVLEAGANYGWPDAIGWESAGGSRVPVWTWREPIAPGGVSAYRGPIADWAGGVLVAGLRGRLDRIVLERSGEHHRATAMETLLNGEFGRLRTVVVDTSGSIYLTTSNRDARGVARVGDDLLLRLKPVVRRELE